MTVYWILFSALLTSLIPLLLTWILEYREKQRRK